MKIPGIDEEDDNNDADDIIVDVCLLCAEELRARPTRRAEGEI